MKKRTQRHEVIREIVRDNNIRTQRDLAEKLQEAGHDCTQATISRDITDMELLKSKEGFYVLPEDMRLQHMVVELVEEVYTAGYLVIVRTFPGGAAGVAGAIDNAGLNGSLGTVAGDNTIMIAARTPEDALNIKAELDGLRRR
ncbi:MAG: ArgR family transcriptional regulator [Eggerthellaceae bacterium]|jgi:transcriptional regulator of arginine metabolism|uniref:Arginine repressor n=1 Tax=Denitrobacterium detoxificans TaxID=79604 RepID=A0A172RWK6_9ACTN|nr:ArgR family transcriptional regulator [Denitrobacterium detoxificans]ANE22106.1 ArgR family transcriptional regulator [Denitrobacterium detoxificans]MBE6466365.1 ArgR family transcriptional regulator [Denitrobacterium detoxificans]MCR5582986.1 ArgR family transcriptional regulator [Eggerthellaceae bacterium]SEO88756.1 transcriptional regulator, ArgR family [Denitrobacterium detoxificans]